MLLFVNKIYDVLECGCIITVYWRQNSEFLTGVKPMTFSMQEKDYVSLIENYICPRGYSHSIHDGRGREWGEVQQSFKVWTPQKNTWGRNFSPKNCLHQNFLPPKIQKTTTPLYTDVFNQIDTSNAWFCINKLINFIYLLMSLRFPLCTRCPLVESVALPLHHFMLITQLA